MSEDFEKIIERELSRLPTYSIEIGVFSANRRRKMWWWKYRLKLNNAELMFIHENGSPANNIPDRPVLDLTIKHFRQNGMIERVVDRALSAYISSNFDREALEKELNKLCIRMENYAREIIYSNDGRLKPNSPKVAKKKKGNHPLFDTGQLARSITCRLVKS